jgi:hypothetical protein
MTAPKLCQANIGTREQPFACSKPVAPRMLACCLQHRRVPIRTAAAGVYKRGGSYVIRYRVNGQPRWEAFRTYKDAVSAKSARKADRDRGELH